MVLRNIYIICLTVGGVFAVLSFVFGNLLDFDFDFDFDFDLDFTLPIKPFTLMVFLAVFGGVGLIAWQTLPAAWSLLPAVPAGVLIAWALYHFVYAKLKKYESRAPSENDTLMQRADVVEAIPAGGYGKISFVINGNTISGAARAKDPARAIGKGCHVYIVDHADNTYFVYEDLELYIDELTGKTGK